jgi:hypothetical protein
MTAGPDPGGLRLTEEEAFALLGLCLTSPNLLDKTSERALRKLAEYCSTRGNSSGNHTNRTQSVQVKQELGTAGV